MDTVPGSRDRAGTEATKCRVLAEPATAKARRQVLGGGRERGRVPWVMTTSSWSTSPSRPGPWGRSARHGNGERKEGAAAGGAWRRHAQRRAQKMKKNRASRYSQRSAAPRHLCGPEQWGTEGSATPLPGHRQALPQAPRLQSILASNVGPAGLACDPDWGARTPFRGWPGSSSPLPRPPRQWPPPRLPPASQPQTFLAKVSC